MSRKDVSRMGQMWAGLVALTACALAGTAMPAHAQDGETVRIAIEGAFPPFSYVDANKEMQGFDVDIANAVCAQAKLNCILVLQKWDDMIPGLLAKSYDAIVASMSITPERRKQIAFSVRYYNSPSTFIAAKESGIVKIDPKALNGKRIGATTTTIQSVYLDKNYKNTSEIVMFATSDAAYEALAGGSIDAVLDDKLAVLDWLTNTKMGRCCHFVGGDLNDNEDFGEGAGIALRKEDTALRESFNLAIQGIQSNGVYDEINSKYFPFSIR